MILACIVTFNPDKELLVNNIEAILYQVDKVIIVDNASQNQDMLLSNINKKYSQIEIIKNIENLGVATALNQALDYGQINSYEWVLTLDQDSVCEQDFVKKYVQFIKSTDKVKEILLLCPKIIDINRKNEEKSNTLFEEIKVAITSGSLLNIENSIKIGGFLDLLFIDYVDFEFCLRGKLGKFKIIRLNNAILYHRLGEIQEKNIFGLNIIITNHSPFRRYYLYRNKVFIYKEYFLKYGIWVIRDIISSLKTLFIIIFFEKRKFEQLSNIFKGIKDGFKLKI